MDKANAENAPQPVYASDYRPPDYRITHAYLEVELDPAATKVLARLEVEAAEPEPAVLPPLILNGENLTLCALRLNGAPLSPGAYALDAEHLTIDAPGTRFQLEIETRINPSVNTALEGLYLAEGVYCTQCEPQGFRHITYFIDRPDNLTIFRVRIIGEKESNPALLSNGNLTASGELPDGRRWAEWHDPFPKPSYLFALVAGNLACVQDGFTTMSGRHIDLCIYTDPGMEDRAAYAMDCLKRAMRWDETTFGLEYDLDIYMIVATSRFNMGAMENKGLNIFNDKYVLARADTATDADFAGIERVIAHEYFHNWTGNRVTCRDWFQLSLKEGLTVFRDQEFCADQRSRGVARIEDVRALRARQFAEDAGPLAHAVRPDSYIEINNFYTATVYEKGAELVRMLQTLIGREAFVQGLRLYLRRHDGTAATVEDFISAMQEAGGKDLAQFRTWYAQAGTPEISVAENYDAMEQRFELTFTQNTQPTPGQTEKKPLHIPVAFALLDAEGAELPSNAGVLDLKEAVQTFAFEGVKSRPVASLFRGFSSPITLKTPPSPQTQAFLMALDGDPFNRWEAGQQYALTLLANAAGNASNQADAALQADFISVIGAVLKDAGLEKAFVAAMLGLPSEQEIARRLDVIDPTAVRHARENLRCAIARALKDELLGLYHANRANHPYSPDSKEAGRRALRNAALSYLALNGDMTQDVLQHYRTADNMTDAMAALSILTHMETPERAFALDDFHKKWRDDALVLDKWFSVQALSHMPDTLARVNALLSHEKFSLANPNRVRALIGAFCHSNQPYFHAADGSGYRFFTDQVLALDPINPQVAARLLTAMDQWRRFDAARQGHARAALHEIISSPGISRNVFEIAVKTLGADSTEP